MLICGTNELVKEWIALHIHFVNYKICVNDHMYVHECGGDPQETGHVQPQINGVWESWETYKLSKALQIYGRSDRAED